jgi:hypothetical protein
MEAVLGLAWFILMPALFIRLSAVFKGLTVKS